MTAVALTTAAERIFKNFRHPEEMLTGSNQLFLFIFFLFRFGVDASFCISGTKLYGLGTTSTGSLIRLASLASTL